MEHYLSIVVFPFYVSNSVVSSCLFYSNMCTNSRLRLLLFIVLQIIVFMSVIAQEDESTVQEKYLYDFTRNATISGWTEQSDTVRTVGMSKAVMVVHENTEYRRAVFFALLNPQANGAGFAGVRALGMYYLAGFTKLQIRCRAQGQYNGYKIVLRHKNLNDEPNYSFEQYFQGPRDEFAIRTLPFSEFKAYFRGKRVNNNETLDLARVTSIGIQMYGGVYQPIKQKGPATLEIDWIRAV